MDEWKTGNDEDGEARFAKRENVDDVRDAWVDARRPVCRTSYGSPINFLVEWIYVAYLAFEFSTPVTLQCRAH